MYVDDYHEMYCTVKESGFGAECSFFQEIFMHFSFPQNIYRTRAIISRDLYFFTQFSLWLAYIADNLCTKNGKSSFLKLKIRDL